MDNYFPTGINSISLTETKAAGTCLLLKNEGNNHFKKNEFRIATEIYTQSLRYAPPHCEPDKMKTSFGELEEYPIGVLYSNRSAALFRMKKYDLCVKDIYRSWANGPQNHSRQLKVMTRLAWSYWHLKKVKECEMTVKSMLSQNGETKTTRPVIYFEHPWFGQVQLWPRQKMFDEIRIIQFFCQEVKVLQHLIHKAKMDTTNHTKTKDCEADEDECQRDVLTKLDINFDKSKGRFLTAKGYMTSTDDVINERAFCGILNQRYLKTHCSFCFKDCRISGVPCHGCTHVMYCDDVCRHKAWVMHHWLECCMWPVIYKSEIFSHMALRMILHGAFELSEAKFDEKQKLISGHTCSSIASHMKSTCLSAKPNTTAKHKKKQLASQTTTLVGLNPNDDKYYGKYWGVYSLQTHFHDHGKARVSKCETIARFLATVVEECIAIPQSSSKSKHITNIESLLNQVFGSLVFPAMHENFDSMFNVEDFRNQVKTVCEKFGKQVPHKNMKQQTYSVSKEMPRNTHDVLAHLIRHHMLQLYTNSQAVIQVLSEGKAHNEVETVSQQRLALCVFPHCSLLNHSCDANTFVSFDGDRILVKMLRTANVGEEISHSYGPCVTRYSYKDRQKVLKEQYFFKCECTACMKHKTASSDEQALMDQLTAFKCNSCSGPVKIIESSRDTKSTWGKCIDQSCMKLHDLTKVHQLYIDTMEEVNFQAFKIMNGNVDKAIDVLMRSLKTLETVLYKNHQTLGALHDQVAYCYSQNSNIPMAIEHIIKSLKIIALKFGSKSIEYGREIYKLCALYFKTGQYFLAHKYLLIACPILVGFLPAESKERKDAEQMKKFLDCMDLQLKLPTS